MKFIRKHFSVIILALILLISFLLRIYKIAEVPPSLNWDEVSHGYNAFSILQTGKDEWGVFFPMIFRAYGDYKLPLYIYLTTIPVFFLGLNELSVRLVSVLSGVGLVLLAYLITRKITKNETISLFAGFLTAVSPWSLFVSRIAVEANLGAFLFALGIYTFFLWFDKPKIKWLVWTIICWGFSLYSYNSGRLIVPIFLILLLIFAWKRKYLKQLFLPVMVFLVFFIPLVFQFLNDSGKARFNLVSIVDQGAVNQIIEKRSATKLPSYIARLVFNKPSYFIYKAIGNYISNFSPKYLFFYGGSHYQFSLPNRELLYFVTAPFLILGLFKALTAKNDFLKILCLWFFLSFIPSAITRDAPHVLRSIFVLPTPMIITAIGTSSIIDFFKNKSKFGGKLILFVLIGAVLFSLTRWWKDYQTVYSKSYSWAWQYGYKEAIFFIKQNYESYDKIFFSKRYGEPHEFVLFYYPWDPKIYQTDSGRIWNYHADWFWINGFDKFVFVNDWEVVEGVKCEMRSEKCLLITSPGNYPEAMPAGRQGWNIIKTINFLDGNPAFEILESN